MGGVDPDDRLFERFRDGGDVAALGELFDRAAPTLLCVAVHLARDPAGAEDLVQSAFVRAIEARDEWDGRRAVLPWLLGILHNRARQARRREERRPDPARLAARPPLDPVSAAERAEFDAAVDAAIAELPEAYRPVLRLHLAYGHTPAEIAHALERPPATVRSQLARGLERLRRRLPVGFAALAVAGLSSGRGLAAVRVSVLDQAAAAVPASAIGPLIGGALVMKAKVLSAAAVLVAVGAVVWLARPAGVSPDATIGAAEAETAVLPPPSAPTAASLPEEDELAPGRVAVPVPDAGTTGALRLTCRWGEDGSPADGVRVTAVPFGAPNGLLAQRSARTGAYGTLVMSELPAGTVQLGAERGGGTTVEVAPGETTDAELVIPAGVMLRGRVVNMQGAPVPRARVWLSTAVNAFDRGTHVATADADGRFELRSVEPGRFVSADAPGLRAAVVQPVRGQVGDVVEVELVLTGRGATLVGTVVGADGRVAPGARVLVGRLNGEWTGWSPGLHAEYGPSQELTTDERGTFRVDGLEPGGEVPVWVRASGHCAWTRRVALEEAGETTLTVRLERGGRIEGRVTDGAGDPVGGAFVLYQHAHWLPEDQDVRLAVRPRWANDTVVAGPDGRYGLDHVPPGPIRLWAGAEGREVRGRVTAADSLTVTWDPVLVDRAIRGRVLDQRGAPLAGVRVSCAPPPGRGKRVSAITGEDGRFRCEKLAPESHVLRFWAPDDTLRARPAATVWRVMPGGEELTVSLSDAALPTASITGRLLDVEGRPPPVAEVCCSAESLYWDLSADVDPATGRFQLGPLPPGTYRVQTRRGEPQRYGAWSEPFALLPGEERDLGTLALQEPGSIAVRVVDEEGEPIDGARVAVEHDTGWSTFLASPADTVDGRARLADVAPGSYRVALIGGRKLPYVFAPVTVRSGEETAVELRVPPSVECQVVLLPPTEPVPIHETFVWRRDGELHERWLNHWESSGEVTLTQRLVPGDWEVEITSESGQRELTRFRIDPATHTVRIPLP